MKTCPDCAGHGWQVPEGEDFWSGWPTVTCDTCRGAGFVPEPGDALPVVNPKEAA